jgi:hypothetical protein
VAAHQQQPPGQPWPRVDATFVAIIGLIFTAFVMSSGRDRYPSQLAGATSVGVLSTFLASLCVEARGGLRNLVRADLIGIAAFYYLTLYEFLFPQPNFDTNMPDLQATYLALWAVIIGFAGLFLGRHLIPRGRQPFEPIMTRPVHSGWMLSIFWVSFFLGYLYMLLAVDFDVQKMIDAMMRARFDQPWGRGKFGDWKALLNEFALLLYLIPPIAGLMLGRRDRFSWLQLGPVLLGFAWVLFTGFLGGTRTVFGAYLVTFLVSFTFASPPEKRRQVLIVAAACAAGMVMSTKAMLEMRTIGFKRWMKGDKETILVTRQNSAVFVDDNLYAIARLTQYFPRLAPNGYLGLEVPYLALIRPIPRALWPGKPKGMSVSIEDVFKAKGVTIAATFAGEAYMAGGLVAVALEALVLGMMSAFWNRLASPRNSELGILIYSSGFFAVTIVMRSTFALTTALLPCIAGILFGKFILPKVRERLAPRPVLPPRLRSRPPAPPPGGV